MQADPVQLEQSGVTMPILVQLTMEVAMVDTGARTSLFDISFAREPGIREEGEHEITGVTGQRKFPKFSTAVEIPWLEVASPSPVCGAPLRESRLPWHALIGRDLTRQFEIRVDVSPARSDS